MTLAIVAEFLNGLVLDALCVLMAFGLSIIFGMVGVINFAHDALFTFRAYGIEATLLQRLYVEDPLQGLLLTFGLVMVPEQAIRIAWGLSYAYGSWAVGVTPDNLTLERAAGSRALAVAAQRAR